MVNQNAVQYFDFLESEYDATTGHMVLAVDEDKEIKHTVYTGESRNVTPFSHFDSQGGTAGIRTENLSEYILRKKFISESELNAALNKISQQILEADNAEYSMNSPTSRYNRNK
jgi:hypothetical protein